MMEVGGRYMVYQVCRLDHIFNGIDVMDELKWRYTCVAKDAIYWAGSNYRSSSS